MRGRLPKSPFCAEIAEKEAYNQRINCKCTKDQVEDYVRKYVQEERLRDSQARRAIELDETTAWRLMEGQRQSDTTDTCSDRTNISKRKFVKRMKKKKKKKCAGTEDCFDPKLRMDKSPAELTSVTIFPNQGGETIVGTLEAHAHGFVYVTSKSHMHFMYRDVQRAFIRVEDEKIKMPPLLHFHLKHPIQLGTKQTLDIQFHLLHNPVELRISDDDSYNNIANEKKTRNKSIEDFAKKVESKWKLYPSGPSIYHFLFSKLEKRDELIHGVLLPSKEMVFFCLPSYSLVVLSDTLPFMVMSSDIEIVHLANLRPGEIDMTVVFKDFKRDLLQINSIPLESLDSIKQGLNCGMVKYYVNAEERDWKSIVKGIVASPETFIKQGGWKFFDLEDPATMRYYLHYILEEITKQKEGYYDMWI